MVIFKGNAAGVAGDVLYGRTLPECNTTFDISQQTGFDISQQTGFSIIASMPETILFCKDNAILYNELEMNVTVPNTAVEMYIVHVPALNSLNNASNASVIWDTGNAQTLKASCTTVEQTVYLNFTTTCSLQLQINLLNITNSSYPVPIGTPLLVNVNLEDCPVGFVLEIEEKQCTCASSCGKWTLV